MSHFLNIAILHPPRLTAWDVLGWVKAQLGILFSALGNSARIGENVSDEALMSAYLAGDHRAFRQLFDRFAPGLHRAALRRGLSQADANDVVQQTFIHLHQSRRSFKAGASVRPWVYTIAFNVMRDFGRRFQAMSRLKERMSKETDVFSEPPSDEAHPLGRALKSAMDRLSQAQREVLELHYFEEMSFQEIANLLGSGEGAIRVRAHRAYEKLRSILKGSDVKGGAA